MTKTCAKNRGQGDAQRWHNFKTSKAHCFAAKSIDFYSFVCIAVHVKRLLDHSVLSPDVYVCFRTPGTPPCRFLHVMNPMSQLGHHTLTFNDVHTSVKRNPSPFQEKSFTCKFRHERTTHSKTLAPFLNYESMENVLTLKIRYCNIDNQ